MLQIIPNGFQGFKDWGQGSVEDTQVLPFNPWHHVVLPLAFCTGTLSCWNRIETLRSNEDPMKRNCNYTVHKDNLSLSSFVVRICRRSVYMCEDQVCLIGYRLNTWYHDAGLAKTHYITFSNLGNDFTWCICWEIDIKWVAEGWNSASLAVFGC